MEKEELRTDRAVKMLYDERKDFIIIGLTGRTGSGCTTTANQLCTKFDELEIPRPLNEKYNTSEERKYHIIYEYAKENWENFKLIKFRDIITSFILEYEFEELIEFLKKISKEIDLNNINRLEISLAELKSSFDSLHETRIQIKNEIMNQTQDIVLRENYVYNFYFKHLAEFSVKLQKILKKHQADLYTILYQIFGNNVRSSGKVYEDEFDSRNIFKLSQRTNKLIKILRKRNLNRDKENMKKVLVVIDALRNPYEATFFKDRYSAFYLFSVNTSDKTRIERLSEKGLNKIQIRKLDDQEYPEKQQGKDIFSSQNIQRCLELVDVHLYNPNIGTEDFSYINRQLIKYVSLIMHPGIITPTHIERCMQIAYNSKVNSGCLSRQVGAAVTDKNYSIKSIGWNSTPEGQIPCNLRDAFSLVSREDKKAFSNYEKNNEDFFYFVKNKLLDIKGENSKSNGRLYPYCFKDAYNSFKEQKNQVHTRSLHAEENAFLQLIKNGGVSLEEGNLFTTASPCELCAKKAYQIGIKKIYYIDPYPGISQKHILECGNNEPEMELFRGAIGRAYEQLYTPLIPYKDELYMLYGYNFK